jgi:DNA-binding FadR family transcriptional regulator
MTMPHLTAVRVPKAGEMVAAHIRKQIVRGRLREGQALPPESALMEQFGVSRPTLREAFRILESERLIDVRRGVHGGARVLVPSSDVAAHYTGLLLQHRHTKLVDVYEARTSLELMAVTTLARKRTAADLRKLDESLAEGEEVADGADYAPHDTRFHLLLMELAGNETLGLITDMLFFILTTHNRAYLKTHSREEAVQAARTSQRAHVKLVELVRQKESDAAVAFWRRHLNQVTSYMVPDKNETVLDLFA